MKRIEDTSKDIQNIFEGVWQEFLKEETNRFPYQVCGDFFLAGRASIVEECAGAKKQKRTISSVMDIDGQVYIMSSDGKLFMKNGHLPEWVQLPDLPQD